MEYASRYGFELIKNEDDAGYDIRTPFPIFLEPGFEAVIHTGLRLDATTLEEPHFMMIVPRSSAGTKNDLIIQNTVGIIDPSYNGNDDEIIVAIRRRQMAKGVVLGFEKEGEKGVFRYDGKRKKRKQFQSEVVNGSGWKFVYESYLEHYGRRDSMIYRPGERFCQLLFLPFASPNLELVNKLSAKNRGGFGSTGDT